MRTLILLGASLLLASQAQAIELAKYPQVFDTGQGVMVTLAPSTDGKQALLQVKGLNHPLDEVVFLTEIDDRGNEERDYSATLDGGRYNMLLKRQTWGNDSYQLYLPDTPGFPLAFDEAMSKAAKPTELLALYEQQQSKGVQEKLARFDRSKHLQTNQRLLKELDEEASDACGVPLQTRVEWNAIDDEKMKALSIAGYCGEVVNQLASLCESDADFKTQVATLKGVECRFDKAMKLREKEGQILFTTEQEAPNQGEFINAFLRNR